MLYRLDYITRDGVVTHAVHDPVIGGDLLTMHASTARRRAADAAKLARLDVQVSRIGKAGRLTPSIIVHPNGTASRPPQARPANPREVCRKSEGGAACFCTPCREERSA